MHAAILGRIDGEARDLPIESKLDGSYPAIDAASTAYLDGKRIFHGVAAGRIDVETDVVYINEQDIVTERETERETVHGEWYADFDAGWMGVSTSDMDWLFDHFGVRHGVEIRDGVIDLDAFAEYIADHPSSSAWQTGRKKSLDEDDDAESVQIDYHDTARMQDARHGDNVQLGFQYRWDGSYVRGTITRSGYVAIYKDMPESTYARWMADEVVPFLTSEAELEFQEEVETDTVDEAERGEA